MSLTRRQRKRCSSPNFDDHHTSMPTPCSTQFIFSSAL